MLSSVLFSPGVVGRHSIYNTSDGLLRHDIDVIAAGVRPILAVRWYWTGVDTRKKLQRSLKVSFKDRVKRRERTLVDVTYEQDFRTASLSHEMQ